jgi:hypothetical protein
MEISSGSFDYNDVDIFSAYMIMIFRNSIGDTTTPSYDKWDS